MDNMDWNVYENFGVKTHILECMVFSVIVREADNIKVSVNTLKNHIFEKEVDSVEFGKVYGVAKAYNFIRQERQMIDDAISYIDGFVNGDFDNETD